MRSIVLFLHIVGVVGLFAGIAFEAVSLASLRRATTSETASSWAALHGALPRVYGVASGLILLSGIYLARRVGVFDYAWVRLAVALLVLMGIAGGTAIRSTVQAIQDGQILRGWLRASLVMRAAMGLAAVYLMIDKPLLSAALLVIGVAAVTGVAVSLAARSTTRGA